MNFSPPIVLSKQRRIVGKISHDWFLVVKLFGHPFNEPPVAYSGVVRAGSSYSQPSEPSAPVEFKKYIGFQVMCSNHCMSYPSISSCLNQEYRHGLSLSL